ncbi:MAG: hypothetical protein HC812_01500 [Leptolyngbya sp. RL_3_1]|nr:hypothetical protein [Leptolyngbya sp. RL_3_1]
MKQRHGLQKGPSRGGRFRRSLAQYWPKTVVAAAASATWNCCWYAFKKSNWAASASDNSAAIGSPPGKASKA